MKSPGGKDDDVLIGQNNKHAVRENTFMPIKIETDSIERNNL